MNFIVDETLEDLMKGISRLGELRVSSSSAQLPTSRALRVAQSDSDPEDELDIRGSRDTKGLNSLKYMRSATMFANLKETFSERSATDTEACWINGIAYLPSCQIILVDGNNNKLKTISSEFKLVAETSLEHQPFGTTAMSPAHVAVTIPRENRIDVFRVGSSLTHTQCADI